MFLGRDFLQLALKACVPHPSFPGLFARKDDRTRRMQACARPCGPLVKELRGGLPDMGRLAGRLSQDVIRLR